MKRIITLAVLFIGISIGARAQDSQRYHFTFSDFSNQKDTTVLFRNPQSQEGVKVRLDVNWDKKQKSLKLTFDRKSVPGNDFDILFFPLSTEQTTVKEIIDCKSLKKTLWHAGNGANLNPVRYFMEADSLDRIRPNNCFAYLPNNNEIDFTFDTPETHTITIRLNGLYVGKVAKRPWYTFSGRDKKIEYKAEPVTITLHYQQEAPTDRMEEKVVAFLQEQMTKLDGDAKYLFESQQARNCNLFSVLQHLIKQDFINNNIKCEKFKDYAKVAPLLKQYNYQCERLMEETCSAPQAATCSLSEQEITQVNNQLKNLQMKITLMKKNNEDIEAEKKEFLSILSGIDSRITPECKRKYKRLLDAYMNYCDRIQGLL